MTSNNELPVIRAWYEFTIWLWPKVGRFPRDQKYLLGDKIQTLMLGILDLLIQAKFQRERSGILDRANIELEKLRFHLRMTHDLSLLSTKAFGQASERLLDVGTQVGAWKRASVTRNAT